MAMTVHFKTPKSSIHQGSSSNKKALEYCSCNDLFQFKGNSCQVTGYISDCDDH